MTSFCFSDKFLCFRVGIKVRVRVKVEVRVRISVFGKTSIRASILDPHFLCQQGS